MFLIENQHGSSYLWYTVMVYSLFCSQFVPGKFVYIFHLQIAHQILGKKKQIFVQILLNMPLSFFQFLFGCNTRKISGNMLGKWPYSKFLQTHQPYRSFCHHLGFCTPSQRLLHGTFTGKQKWQQSILTNDKREVYSGTE